MSTANVVAIRRFEDFSRDTVREAIATSLKRVAPLWPLDHFVAVNPFLGFTEESFAEARRRVARSAGARMLNPRRFYAEALARGRIQDEDLVTVISRARRDGTLTAEDLRAHASSDETFDEERFITCADIALECSEIPWPEIVTDRVSRWAAAYFDRGQAVWSSPFRTERPFLAWRQEMAMDCTDTALGLEHVQSYLADLADDPQLVCEEALRELSVPDAVLDTYLHRLLMSIGGWVAYVRYLSWSEELAGKESRWVIDMLAIRLCWEVMLLRDCARKGAQLAWRRALGGEAIRQVRGRELSEEEIRDQLLQEAYENAWNRAAIRSLASRDPEAAKRRPSAQLVFCIDVRSEVFRRALESVSGDVETLGFAGFFGLPVEYVPLASQSGSNHCPVLLEPAIKVRESFGAERPEALVNRLSQRVREGRKLARGWRSFRNFAVASFAFVESCGLAYAVKLAGHTLGLTRAEPAPEHRGLPPRLAEELGPQLDSLNGEGGIGLDRQIDFAESMLRGMSLTENFAPLVVLAGHGSSTTNNAHGTGLDCGACGGQTGEASARLGAMILNNRPVREALVARGIEIPQDTIFLGGLHNTTTDDFELFDLAMLPPSHKKSLDVLRAQLERAGDFTRRERGKRLSFVPDSDPKWNVLRRSRDWSEVRPEWGLAGCAGFIAAPRPITRGIDLGGRCFLHSYDHRMDTDYKVLELIMTAPLVVASWINLQYYGSTVDNRVFGSGNKTLHDVVGGGIGVFEGNGGDLRVGLPLQSVHNGREFVHEAQRLSVFIAAPIVAINRILERHPQVRELVDNKWLHLHAVYDDGAVVARYSGDLNWEAADRAAAELPLA